MSASSAFFAYFCFALFFKFKLRVPNKSDESIFAKSFRYHKQDF